ncbi:hypothetical protein [Thiocystis violacea]|uniref:hypothetical protein n=1 Tax=Thiocystis violacea TaxID=13725 RepID=UPI0019069BC5|nr:hypothetical protein [Thiocystis violacea]
MTSDVPRVLEVNPRLTTSYAGLAEALGINPAELVLGLQAGRRPAPRQAPVGRSVEICLEYAGVA